MNLEAAGAYLTELRKQRGISQARLAGVVGVTDDNILRVEKGRGETAGSVLLQMIDFLGGSFEEYYRIVRDASVTPEQARALAQGRAQQADGATPERTISDREAAIVLEQIHQIAALPFEQRVAELRKLPHWIFVTIEALAFDLLRAAAPRGPA